MAKNIVAKTWSAPTDADGWVYTGPPGDVTPPTKPILAPITNITDTSFVARLSVVSTDAQSGVAFYTPYVAPVSTLTYVALTQVSEFDALQGVTISGRDPSTAYSVKFTATDGSGNVSADSATVTATTLSSQPVTSWFPNWPMMAMAVLPGNYTLNIGDTTQRDFCGEKDLILWQGWFYPTNARYSARIAALSYLRTNFPNCKLAFYTIAQETLKTVTTPGNNPLELTKALIDGPDGSPTWYARRVGGQQTESLNAPTTDWQCNQATNDAAKNSKGERYDQAYARMLDETFNQGLSPNFLNTYVDAIYLDNFESRPPLTYINNGATAVTDMDFDQDGTVDVINGYNSASNAGGRMWSEGGLNFKATLESRFNRLVIPNAARWGIPDYEDSRKLPPPLPLSNHPYYGKWSIILKEHHELDWGFRLSTSGYTITGGLNATYAFRCLTVQEKFLCTDSASKAGRAAVMVCSYAPDRTLATDDITYGRFMSAVCLLMERCAPAIQASTKRPVPVDEQFVYLGAPLVTRSMGALNENNLAFTLRAPNYTSGAAQFHWVEFQGGIVVLRTDTPTAGVWPSADSAVACVLPSAGTGKKWQAFNSLTYVNPITGRKCRGQNTTLNNGADLTNSAALKPWHAQFILRVPA